MTSSMALEYAAARQRLLDTPHTLLDLEYFYTDYFRTIAARTAARIAHDFDKATMLLPFWKNYPPRQRGRAPTGTSIPWSEVGQTAIVFNIVRSLAEVNPDITFPGLPSGADLRLLTRDALIHFDVKVTGPNDRADEVVASPNQISGDGVEWRDGVINSPVSIKGDRAAMIFQPELPPLYLIDGQVYPCVTIFLKGVYSVMSAGYQPLTKLELICVPNGLLCFTGLSYVSQAGLFIPGKDEQNHLKKRVRVRMGPLASLAAWRRVVVWERAVPDQPALVEGL